MAKNLDKSGRKNCIAALAAAVGLILYIFTSTTGYLAETAMSPLPVVCTAAALVLLGVLAAVSEKLSPVLKDLVLIAASVLLMAGFALFTLGRVSLAADIYFIPVNYPQSEVTSLYQSVAGVVFYLIAIITTIVTAFTGRE